jgi:hypothetical protein
MSRSLICWENLTTREKRRISGRSQKGIIKNGDLRKRMEGVEWIVLDRKRDGWRSIVNAVIKSRVP